MLLPITRRPRKLILAVPAVFFAFALLLVLLPLIVQAAPENWRLRSSAGSACGNGDRESLNQTAGSNAATKALDGSGDTWNRTESARTIGAGDWQLFFDATTGSGGGSPNKVTVLVERRNSSCVVQGSAIINEEVTTTKGATQEYATAATASGSVDLAAGDLITVTLTQTNGGQTVTLRYDGADGGDADSKLVHPGEPTLVSVSDSVPITDSAQSAVSSAVSAAAGITDSIGEVLGIHFTLEGVPILSDSVRVGLGIGPADAASFQELASTGFIPADTSTTTDTTRAAIHASGVYYGSVAADVLTMFPENDRAKLGDTVDYFVIRSEDEGDFPVGVPVTAPGPVPPFGSTEVISQTAALVISNQETRLETPDGMVELVVSPGSLPPATAGKTVEINLQNLNPATVPTPPLNMDFIRAVQIDSLVNGVGSPVIYDNLVLLQFPFISSEPAGGDPSGMTVFRFDPVALSWAPLATTFSDSSTPPYLEAELDHFSLFAVGVLQSIPPTPTLTATITTTPAPTAALIPTPRPSPTPFQTTAMIVVPDPTPLPSPAPTAAQTPEATLQLAPAPTLRPTARPTPTFPQRPPPDRRRRRPFL